MLDITLIILRWKRVLQIVLPVAFTLDAAHNAYIMYKLYEGRLKDWEEERHLEVMHFIIPALGRVSAHCQRRDQAFWPDDLSRRLGLPHPSLGLDEADSAAIATEHEADPFEQMGFGRGWTVAADDSRHAASAEAYADACASAGRQPLRKKAAPHSQDECWAPDRLVRLAAGWCERAASAGQDTVERALQVGVARLQQTVPVPRVSVSRRSALRVTIFWHGFSQPIAQMTRQSCELHLS